ncbi:MAG: DUF1211 domain-containing protein [Proteobacteria bacterium]|nr:DUF1211 domain-containing protein [Pseudomonadota bacterium]
MDKGRLEAFSDGVIAVILTIMVLEMHAPHAPSWQALAAVWPTFLCYVLSFIYVGIYWNNHHHMLHATRRIDGSVLWANLHLLFWLSLVPFVTAWMGENHFAALPTALYGGVLLMAAIAYWILQQRILCVREQDPMLARAIGSDWKGKLSPLAYLLAIAAVVVNPWVTYAIYALVALAWLVPDRRIESRVTQAD